MGLLSKIKNKLGIGGVKVELQVPAQVSKEVRDVNGKIIMTTKSEQEILEIEVKFMEEFTTGRGDNKKSKLFELGIVKLSEKYIIKPGDSIQVDFNLPFTLMKSNVDSLKEKGGALGVIGSMGKFANNEKSSYYIEADVDVKSAVLDPSDKKNIKLI